MDAREEARDAIGAVVANGQGCSDFPCTSGEKGIDDCWCREQGRVALDALTKPRTDSDGTVRESIAVLRSDLKPNTRSGTIETTK